MTQADALAWLGQAPDATGECDGCHADDVKVWALPQEAMHEEEAAWLYCRRCYTRLISRRLPDAG